MQQAIDFKEESHTLYALIEPLSPSLYEHKTGFKSWSVNNVLRHLHLWNYAAHLSLIDEKATSAFLANALQSIGDVGFTEYERRWCDDLSGPELLATWRGFVDSMSLDFAAADPKARVKWAGPDMSVRSSITARLMETWAHGQAIYDLLGILRVDHDRIKNIATLGVNTFAWTFCNRGLQVPKSVPYVELVAPSGGLWSWGDVDHQENIRGSATSFCQTVTQTRNVHDTDLVVTGTTARQWMSIAQCFAGPPMDPPAPGTRLPQSPGGEQLLEL